MVLIAAVIDVKMELVFCDEVILLKLWFELFFTDTVRLNNEDVVDDKVELNEVVGVDVVVGVVLVGEILDELKLALGVDQAKFGLELKLELGLYLTVFELDELGVYQT